MLNNKQLSSSCAFSAIEMKASPVLNLTLKTIAALCALQLHISVGQFYGGSISYTMDKNPDGKDVITVRLLTAWELGKGPCGPGCSKRDIGRSTRSTRPPMLLTYPCSLGRFEIDYRNYTTHLNTIVGINDIVSRSYNETIIAVSEHDRFEQELMTFDFAMPSGLNKLDVNFDGAPWRKLTVPPRFADTSLPWHLQTKISSAVRSDTLRTNKNPQALTRPLYSVKLGEVTTIQIPVVDEDDDFIKCVISEYIEGGSIGMYLAPNVQVTKDCGVQINASVYDNYTDGSWLAVPVTVRDYNRRNIKYDIDTFIAGHYSLSATSVKIVVHVVSNLQTPEFVEPTLEASHRFVLYSNTIWRTDIYVNVTEGRTIESLNTFGIRGENYQISTLHQDLKRPQVTHAEISWSPLKSDVGNHLVCFVASDNTGQDSAEQRCFNLILKADDFNKTTTVAMGKPYFVDVPTGSISCEIQTTCVIALYVKSASKVSDVYVTVSFLNKYQLGPIQQVIHNGDQVYKTDLAFEHPTHGKETICIAAVDTSGKQSDQVCIQTRIFPPDPCLSAPCRNSGTCEMDTDTGGFRCQCIPKYTGKICDFKEDPCNPNPCIKPNSDYCVNINNILCWCHSGFTGPTCSENINDCVIDACQGRGTCKDKINSFDCECFERYNGTQCENDKCPLEKPGVVSCGTASCRCSERGVCQNGGPCECSYGYTGTNCEIRKCGLTGLKNEVEIISPSLKDGSKLICFMKGNNVTSCVLRVYLAVQLGSVPNVYVDSKENLRSLIYVGAVARSLDIPGISTLYTADVAVSDTLNDMNQKNEYICVTASAGYSNSSVCYEIFFVSDPESESTQLAYQQRNASVKFVQPTLNEGSTLLCRTGEVCRTLVYTSFSSERHSCRVNSSVLVPALNVNDSCGSYDKDNDEDDPDVIAKANDPCCVNVMSSTPGVTVYPAHARGPKCVTEVSFKFSNEGEKDMCFLSATSSFQQLCYKVNVFNPASDPCSSSPCLNNGHCFNIDQKKYKCLCPDNYVGDRCQKGPCQPAENNCLHDAYCQTNDGIATCICKAGFSGRTCNEGPSVNPFPKFTDTALPTALTCVLHQQCSFVLILTGQPGHIPTVMPGFVDKSLILHSIETTGRLSVPGSYQTAIRFKSLSVGTKYMCIQTKDTSGVNKDEICLTVSVISDVISVYGYKERPHFIEPSLPMESELTCVADGPCHIVYNATAGTGNENKCLAYTIKSTDGFDNYHLFSSCENCTSTGLGSINCSLDVSLVTNSSDIGANKHLCLSLGLKGSTTTGETRCFNISVLDPSAVSKEGCQALECRNGGFCDGHITAETLCYCQNGFSGIKCEKAEVKTVLSATQTQSFRGDFAIPSKIECTLHQNCYIPFQIVSKSGSIPKVQLGYVGTGIKVNQTFLKSSSDLGNVFEGYAEAFTYMTGNYKVCIQTTLNSKVEDEMCVSVDILVGLIPEKTSMIQPYFLPPTVSTGSIVLCEVNRFCHLNIHYTKGDMFGFPNICPTVSATNQEPYQKVHIFDPIMQADECITDVSHISPLNNVASKLCLQIGLPGRKGERRCFSIKSVSNLTGEVISPCRGRTCARGQKCIANLTSIPYNIQCICQMGPLDNACQPDGNCNKTCLNGGSCVKDVCHCLTGFSGEHCERVLDPCSSNPCVRGTCFHHVRQYHCLCPPGYTGKNCEININECLSLPCQNGGSCVDNEGSFTCNCSPGFTGSICEKDINECSSMPCLNGGFCTDSIDRFLCQCLTGFDGDRCEKVVDPCMKNQCVRGSCFSNGPQFLCDCPAGYTGKLCDKSIQLVLNGPEETYVKVPFGSELSLNCSVSGSYPPQFYWSKLRSCDTDYVNSKASVFHLTHAKFGDAGIYICTASDGHSANLTSYYHVEITSNPKTGESCSFDDGSFCGWSQSTNDSFNWTLQQGQTQSDGTGPNADHTLGTATGNYLYIESSSPRAFGEYADLISPLLPANQTMCFQFWYYMFGDGTGRLFVYLQDSCLQKQIQLLKREGDQGQMWIKATLAIASNSVPNDYRIQIRADVGSTFHGDTSIDDLKITDGPCEDNQGVSIVG